MNYKIILDIPAKDPKLGFNIYADAIKSIIENTEPRFAIGIFGGWGTGKTTLINAIESRLDKDFVIPVSFSAWRYEKEEYLLVPLLDTLREGIQNWSDEHKKWQPETKKFATKIGRIMKSLLAGLSLKFGVPGALDLSFEANKALENYEGDQDDLLSKVPQSVYHACFKALETSLDDFKQAIPNIRIVVFVDDLDRCLPQGALEVMESMKLFFDFDGFIFVVGLDQKIVEKSIDIRYAQFHGDAMIKDNQSDVPIAEKKIVSGKEYIKKIFQVPFALAPVANSQINEFLESITSEGNIEQDQIDDLNGRVFKHLNYLVDHSGVNPRELKRFINSYILIRTTKPYLDPDVILTMEAIALKPEWGIVKENLYIWREGLIAALKKHQDGDEKALENLEPDLAGLPSTFLKYISDDNTGGKLLNVYNIDEYIYSGESLRSPQGGQILVDLIQDIGKIRHEVEELLSNDMKITQSQIKFFASRVHEIKSHSKEFTSSFYGNALFKEMNKINEIVSIGGNAKPGSDKDFTQELNAILNSLVLSKQYVRELFQE